jgi:hypothetical protein
MMRLVALHLIRQFSNYEYVSRTGSSDLRKCILIGQCSEVRK